MNKTKFSVNWNQKLNCNFFTTIRLRNDAYYYKSAQSAIFMKATCKVQDNRFPEEKDYYFLFNAEVVSVENCPLDKLPEHLCYTDTGYDKQKCTNMLRTMYKNNPKASENPEMSIIVFKRVWDKKETVVEDKFANTFQEV